MPKAKAVAILGIGLLVGLGLSLPAHAGSLSTGRAATVTGARPGQVLWTDWAAFVDGSDAGLAGSTGDTIIRVINPNGSANPAVVGTEQTVCAMVYVFDDAEEMGECCGCPVSSAGLLSFSVGLNLNQNFVFGNFDGLEQGVLAIVAASPNPNITMLGAPNNGHGCTVGQSAGCNFGCDPTNNPGYMVTTANNLLGSRLLSYNPAYDDGDEPPVPLSLTEIPLHDDGAGDPANLIYLQNECGQMIGNGTGRGICTCPVPGQAEPTFG